MKSPIPPARAYDFYFPRLDTLVRVETDDERVAIRAARDTFTPARKEAFIRELAAEGFIPDECRWTAPCAPHLRWSVDAGWLASGPADAVNAHRFMRRLLCGATALWLATLAWLVFCPR